MIKINSLSKKYGSLKVLAEVNANFEKNKVYGVIGGNGAGKTTLFNCIAGLEDYKGNIESDVKILKNHLSYLPTELFFFNKMTGREYIQFMCNARSVDTGNIDNRNIFDLPLDKYITTYSSGMKKKLAFISIIMQNSDYYILDEPFNGVDIHSNILLNEIIRKLSEMNKCVIMSSHILSTLKDNCDIIYILKNGILSEEIYKSNFNELEKLYKENIIDNKINRLFVNQ